MEKKTEGFILHSAEHMFARALQNAGLTIEVLKADTFREDGRAFLEIEGKISLENLMSAEKTVNSLIPNSLKTSEEIFTDLEKAKNKYPNLRLNEKRLKDVKNIRVVKIGDFDVCACKNKHVDNTLDIIAFVIIDISYLGGNTKIEFKAARDAIAYFLSINDAVLSVGQSNNFKPIEIAPKFSELKSNLSESKRQLDDVFLRMISSYQNKFLDVGNIQISQFYKTLNKFIEDNPQRCLVILSKSQIFAARGKYNTSKLDIIGSRLRDKKAFVGDVRNDLISGKIINYENTNLILNELEGLIV